MKKKIDRFTKFNKAFHGHFVTLVTKRDTTDYVESKDGSLIDIVNPLAIKGFFIKRDELYYYLGEKTKSRITDVVDVTDFCMMQLTAPPTVSLPKTKFDTMLDNLPTPDKKDQMN